MNVGSIAFDEIVGDGVAVVFATLVDDSIVLFAVEIVAFAGGRVV